MLGFGAGEECVTILWFQEHGTCLMSLDGRKSPFSGRSSLFSFRFTVASTRKPLKVVFPPLKKTMGERKILKKHEVGYVMQPHFKNGRWPLMMLPPFVSLTFVVMDTEGVSISGGMTSLPDRWSGWRCSQTDVIGGAPEPYARVRLMLKIATVRQKNPANHLSTILASVEEARKQPGDVCLTMFVKWFMRATLIYGYNDQIINITANYVCPHVSLHNQLI